MSQTITATFENGIFKPDEELALEPGARVQLIVSPCENDLADDPLSELDRLCDEVPIDSGGVLLTREQLHDRD
jgi:predicted DNA-binding antitoxin AbrB/MazE fold protein